MWGQGPTPAPTPDPTHNPNPTRARARTRTRTRARGGGGGGGRGLDPACTLGRRHRNAHSEKSNLADHSDGIGGTQQSIGHKGGVTLGADRGRLTTFSFSNCGRAHASRQVGVLGVL